MSETIDKIRSFADLPKGWNYGSGGPMPSHMIELAISAEKMLREHGYPETGAFPSQEEISVCGYLNRVCVTINISEETY